ncbi:MAG: flagellar basal body rod C-terminal domain-containing protein [Thermodesulfobacteriota bacterium]
MNNIPSQSALQAFGIRQGVNAHNVANMNTPGFDAKRANMEEMQNNRGVRVQNIGEQNPDLQEQMGKTENGPENGAGDPEQDSGGSRIERSDTDLSREMVKMIENENAYSANASTVRVNQQMSGALLNMTT